jgi:hypothetical protein
MNFAAIKKSLEPYYLPFTAGFVAGMVISMIAGCSQVDHDQQARDVALANSSKNAKLQELLEQQRSTAKANALANAQQYFANNPRFDAGFKIVPHTDDYIQPACVQGSGWAWASIMKVEGKVVEKTVIWCSTSSGSVGCFREEDFKKMPQFAQSTKCDPNLPHPLKPIA